MHRDRQSILSRVMLSALRDFGVIEYTAMEEHVELHYTVSLLAFRNKGMDPMKLIS